MINQIIAYILLSFGVPVLIGTLLWVIPRILLTKALGLTQSRLEESISAFAEGVIASAVGYLIFFWLGAGPLWIVPILVIAIVLIWNNARNEGYLNLPESVGAVLSFLAMFSLFNQAV